MTSISSASPYRVLGPVISVAEFAKTRPGMVIPATQAEISQEKLYHEQFQARLDAIQGDCMKPAGVLSSHWKYCL